MRLRRQPPPPEVVVEYMNAGVALLETASAASKRYALSYLDAVGVIERITFGDVERRAQQWAHVMRKQGLQPGDVVVVLAGRDREWRCALLGVLQAGGVAVPCSATMPVAEICAIAAHAGAVLFVSARARPDLVEAYGTPVLSADEFDSPDATEAPLPAHLASAGEVALILYAQDAVGLHGAVHTHASLLAQAEAGVHWLGVHQDERIWCTAADGSVESIWVLLAAWRVGAKLVGVEEPLDPYDQLDLMARVRPDAVWFSDDEYAGLASAAATAEFAVESIQRVLTSDESADGANAFADAFGAQVARVSGYDETGVVADRPSGVEPEEAPTAVAVADPNPVPTFEDERREEERLRSRLRARREEEQQAKKRQKEEERRRADMERTRAESPDSYERVKRVVESLAGYSNDWVRAVKRRYFWGTARHEEDPPNLEQWASAAWRAAGGDEAALRSEDEASKLEELERPFPEVPKS